uniref:Uncharacterized protein n=1 Tax=Onchocerca volvulus TaxID=6282 RepID=A0A8R1TK01_ONCVO
MAVSRSSPMMIATRMAKRGRCNYVAMYGDESENSDNGSRVEKDLVELNKQLNYTGKPLEADLKATTAMSVAVRNKRHTFENIVNKTKIKMGRLNYSIHLRRTATNDLRKPISH